MEHENGSTRANCRVMKLSEVFGRHEGLSDRD